ncbi:trypsin-like peptidase domain-containing protein [Lentzea albida]|uniref:Trypsin-like peptidase domain-containing protein n=1 Tax=Lentzea albida TaxID=65499 RepID=A0A1H9T1Q8_9PSEU|nr:trypsin-like peptidase domain-containing protein [Lentzea albida]SER90573.1 Trypsin-like peptidase domain-containing protein [Lentzea albida]
MTGAPLDRSRVAELIVTRDGERQRGSGYRVRTDAVLTAAHVVDGASSVRIRFEPDLPGERVVDAVSWWSDPVSDIAVVTIEAEDPVSPVSFGRIENRAAVLAVEAVGFPLWKMRADAAGLKYRDSCHASGTVAVLSNWREGTLEVVVEPAGSSDGDSSPWQGMSGSALWSGGHVVGVIAKHHPGDGLGRLAAARVDLALDRVDPDQGTPLRDVLRVPAPLPGVLPPARSALITNAYQALVAEAAPQHLHDRNWELGELVRFCAGDEPYAWWHAGPWAGKSALLAWFAQHPPDGVDVVSFFVTGRWAGQSDSDAFTEALIDQLAALVGEPPNQALEARARRGHTLRLLNTAAAACAATGRTLLLVVDGLDEDTSRAEGLDRPSIASLLPRRLPRSVRVLVASRPHPELPDDVVGDHPLRTVVPRLLRDSPYAKNLEGEAKRELTTLLAKPGLQRDVLGLITASGGGLTQRDLEELTGRPRYELDALFGGMLGRSVGARAGRDPAERVYLFTHDTLREQAEHKYGTGLAAYREQLDAWAERYRADGWPEHTPVYLFRGHPRLLAALGDTDRMVALAVDRPRHDRMLLLTGADSLALTEIVSAIGLLARAPEPDLLTMLRVAAARTELGARNQGIPAELPGVWARIGHVDRAIALAESFTSEMLRAKALAGIVSALVTRDDLRLVPRLADEAERLARRTGNPLTLHETLATLAMAFAGGAEDEKALRFAAEIHANVPLLGDSYLHDVSLGHLVRVACARGDHDQALAHIAAMSSDYQQSATCEERALVAIRASDDALASRFLRAMTDSYYRSRSLKLLLSEVRHDAQRTLGLLREADEKLREHRLRALGVAAMAAGDDDSAVVYALACNDPDELLADLVEQAVDEGDVTRASRCADEISGPALRAMAWCELATMCAKAGEMERAAGLMASVKALLPDLEKPEDQARVLVGLARIACVTGGTGQVGRLSAQADEQAATIEDPLVRVQTLSAMAAVASLCGDRDRYVGLMDLAEAVAGPVIGQTRDMRPLLDLAHVAADVEDDARARRLVGNVIDEWRSRIRLFGAALSVVAKIGAVDLALRLLEFDEKTEVVHSLLAAAVFAGDRERAHQIMDAAAGRPLLSARQELVELLVQLEEIDLAIVVANSGDRVFDRSQRLIGAAKAAMAFGKDDHARLLITAIGTAYHQNQVLGEIITSLVDEGCYDRAVHYVSAHDDDLRLADLLTECALTACRRGELARARTFLAAVPMKSKRSAGMAALAAAVAASGDSERARALCVEAEEVVRDDVGGGLLDQVHGALVKALDLAGDESRADRHALIPKSGNLRFLALSGMSLAALDRGDVARAQALAADAARIRGRDETWDLQQTIEFLQRTGARETVEQFAAAVEALTRTTTDEFDRPRYCSVLARALATLGRSAQAYALVDEIRGDADKFYALADIARMASASPVGDTARAVLTQLARGVLVNGQELWIEDLVKALVSAGENDLALSLVDGSTESMRKSVALRAVPNVAPDDLRQRHDLTVRCLASAAAIPSPYFRDGVYRNFAAMRDKDGEHAEALRIAQLIDDPAVREETLRDIRLRAVADGRETTGSRKFVADVLATKDWSRALIALGKVDLPVLQRFADEILG